MKLLQKEINCILVVGLLMVLSSALPSFAQDNEPVGIVTAIQGVVTATDNDGTKQLAQGDSIFMGDIIETGEESGVKIVFNDDSLISLGDDTTFEINEFVYTPTKRKAISNLTKGKMRAIIKQIKTGDSDVEFNTPNAVAGIKGTTLYINADESLIGVREGEVVVSGLNQGANSITLGANQYTQIVDGEPIRPKPISEEIWLKFKRETNIVEGLPDRTSLFRQEYPGKEGADTSLPVALGDAITDFPTVPPISLTPGAGAENVVNVDIIVDIN